MPDQIAEGTSPLQEAEVQPFVGAQENGADFSEIEVEPNPVRSRLLTGVIQCLSSLCKALQKDCPGAHR